MRKSEWCSVGIIVCLIGLGCLMFLRVAVESALFPESNKPEPLSWTIRRTPWTITQTQTWLRENDYYLETEDSNSDGDPGEGTRNAWFRYSSDVESEKYFDPNFYKDGEEY